MTATPTKQSEADAMIRLYVVGEWFTLTAFAEGMVMKPMSARRLLEDAAARGIVEKIGGIWKRVK